MAHLQKPQNCTSFPIVSSIPVLWKTGHKLWYMKCKLSNYIRNFYKHFVLFMNSINSITVCNGVIIHITMTVLHQEKSAPQLQWDIVSHHFRFTVKNNSRSMSYSPIKTYNFWNVLDSHQSGQHKLEILRLVKVRMKTCKLQSWPPYKPNRKQLRLEQEWS